MSENQGFIYYTVNSKDRISGTPDDFQIELRNFDNISQYHIEGLCLSYKWYPIRSGVNDRFGVRFAGVDSIINVSEGNYSNATSFASEVETKLKVINAGFTCVYSALTGKLTIAHNASNFDLYFDENSALSGGSRSLYREMGFDTNKTGSQSYTSDKIIEISGFEFVIIECDELMRNQIIRSTDNRDYNNFAKIYIVDSNWGQGIVYRQQLNALHTMDPNFKSKVVRFQVLDQFRRALNLKHDWTFKLKLYRNKDIINI